MKYCPYCGAGLLDGAASFCTECGKALPTGSLDRPLSRKSSSHSPTRKRRPLSSSHRKQNTGAKDSEKPTEHSAPEDGYDGYYNDILPADAGRQREGIDSSLVKRLAAIGAGVILVIGLCITALYLL